MPNRVELIFVGLAFLYMGIIIKREYDGPIFNRGVRVGRYNVGKGRKNGASSPACDNPSMTLKDMLS